MDSEDKKHRDSSLGPNNPFNKLEEEIQQSVRPGFGDKDETEENARGELSAAENAAETFKTAAGVTTGLATGGASLAASLVSGEGGAGFVKSSKSEGFYHRFRADDSGRKKTKGKGKKLSLGFVFVILLVVVPAMLLTSQLPAVLVGTLDMGLQRAADRDGTIEALKKQTEYLLQEALLNGEVPDAFAGVLDEHGIEVGQTTLAGDFVRTNVYLADLDKDTNDVASVGNYELNGDKGELAVKFKDKIIKASDFVATVESDLELYAKFGDAADTVVTGYTYSNEYDATLKENGYTRGTFSGWERTGDEKKDQESFEETFFQAIDKQSAMYINGYRGGGSGDVDRGDESDVDNETSVNSGSLPTMMLAMNNPNADIPGSSDSSNGSDGSGSKKEPSSEDSNNSGSSGNNSSNNSGSKKESSSSNAEENISNYELIEEYRTVTFYGPSAAENPGNPGMNALDYGLADGQAAKDRHDCDLNMNCGVLVAGDVIYMETTDDPNSEGAYANGKYFIITDTGAMTSFGEEGGWAIDVFTDNPNTDYAPFGSIPGVRVYRVASGVSWEEYLEKYHDASGGSISGNGSKRCSNGGVVDTDEGFTVDFKCDAGTIIRQVGTHTTGEASTKKGAQLLSVAVSATEVYKAGSAFGGTEEVLQEARIFGDGPITQLLTLFNSRGKFTSSDVVSHKEKTVEQSVFENANFSAAVSGGRYDIHEAQNYQRDRVLLATGTADNEIINNTTLATSGQKKSNTVLKIESGDSADLETLSKATDSVSIAVSQEVSDIFKGPVGGNWIVNGAGFLLRKVDQYLLGRRPSDAAAIQAYNKEKRSLLAKRAAAERATKSPFDISSENTFLGSIMKNLVSSILANRKRISDQTSTVSLLGAMADLTRNSTNGILGTVVADGPSDELSDLLGINCVTSNSVAGVEGNLYCSEHEVFSTKYYSYTQDDWDNNFDKEERKRAALLGNGRKPTVGIKDGEVCEIYKKEFRKQDEGAAEQIFHSLSDLLSRMAGLYESCGNVDDSISLGANITLSDKNPDKEKVELASGYTLYDMTRAIVFNEKSEMATIRDEYYKKNPRDNSPEARLARISGLSKEEAAIAMNYASYLNVIANYNPATRYAFGDDLVDVPNVVEFIDDEQVETSVYLAWFSKIEYSDVRNRSFVV